MPTINIRDFYPDENQNILFEVSEELAAQLLEWKRSDLAYQRKVRWHHAQYSLDCDDGIERCALGFSLSPAEQYDVTWSMQRLHTALSMLPTAQARRIVAYYFWGISKTDIAHREGVSSAAVGASITRGLRRLKKILKK